jgi:hypothetical protein
MSRKPTRKLTLQFVLRTLTRLQMMTRLDCERLAKQLEPYHRDVRYLAQYLTDVAHYMPSSNEHPHGICDQCGGAIGCDHNGARFCSSRCRQRAYRLRIKERGRANQTSQMTLLTRAGAETNVTQG